MSAVEWNSGEPPKGRRLLLIATPLNMQQTNMAPDIVVGLWHEGRHDYVPLDPPCASKVDRASDEFASPTCSN